MAQERNPYYVDPGNDFSSGLSGLSSTLANVRDASIRQAEEARKQDAYDRAKQRFQDVQNAAQEAFASQDPNQVAKLSIKYPEITEMLKQTAGLQDDMKARDAMEFTRQFATSDPADRPRLYEQRIQAIKARGGDPSHTIQSYQEYLQNPEAETRDVLSYWAGIDPKGYSVYKDRQDAATAAKSEDREYAYKDRALGQQLTIARMNAADRLAGTSDKGTAHMKDFQQYQDLLKSDPAAAKAFGQAAGFVSKEGRELSPGTQTRLATTIDSAVSAENNIGKFNNLADDIEKSDLGGGLLKGSWAEKVKELTGNQDAATDLRREFAQVRASQASANLPPGSASDADVKLALGPIPSDNANKHQLASYLRGQAKLAKINADFHNFKADYISETGSERGMLQAWKQRNGQMAKMPAAAAPVAPSAASPASSGGWEIVQ